MYYGLEQVWVGRFFRNLKCLTVYLQPIPVPIYLKSIKKISFFRSPQNQIFMDKLIFPWHLVFKKNIYPVWLAYKVYAFLLIRFPLQLPRFFNFENNDTNLIWTYKNVVICNLVNINGFPFNYIMVIIHYFIIIFYKQLVWRKW